MLLTKVISTVPRALLRPISKQRCRRRKGPRWSVRRALPQTIGSLIHPDLSCGAVSLPEDLITPMGLWVYGPIIDEGMGYPRDRRDGADVDHRSRGGWSPRVWNDPARRDDSCDAAKCAGHHI